MLTRITKGVITDLKKMTRMMKTMATAMPIARNIDWNDWLISSLVPPVSSLTPAGSGTDCTNAVARCEMPLVSVPLMTALTATSRMPSRRLMLLGAV